MEKTSKTEITAEQVMEERNEIICDKYIIKLVSEAIDATEAIDAVNHHKCGAVSLFMGNTRHTESGDTTGRRVLHLTYEAYHRMALKEMQTIIERNLNRYSTDQIHRCFVAHRLGRVVVGQTSIIIACSGPHRTEAHELVLRLLNDIKAFVPIWKKINYIEGSGDGQTGRTRTEWSDKSEAFWLNSRHKDN